LAALQAAAEAGDDARVRRSLAALVPEAQLSGLGEEAIETGLVQAPVLSST
jgi:hypothetical protein